MEKKDLTFQKIVNNALYLLFDNEINIKDIYVKHFESKYDESYDVTVHTPEFRCYEIIFEIDYITNTYKVFMCECGAGESWELVDEQEIIE